MYVLFWCAVFSVGLRGRDAARRATVGLPHSCRTFLSPHPSLQHIVLCLVLKGLLCLQALLLTQVQGCTKITSPSASRCLPLPLLSAVYLCVSANFFLYTTCLLTSVRFILSWFASESLFRLVTLNLFSSPIVPTPLYLTCSCVASPKPLSYSLVMIRVVLQRYCRASAEIWINTVLLCVLLAVFALL